MQKSQKWTILKARTLRKTRVKMLILLPICSKKIGKRTKMAERSYLPKKKRNRKRSSLLASLLCLDQISCPKSLNWARNRKLTQILRPFTKKSKKWRKNKPKLMNWQKKSKNWQMRKQQNISARKRNHPNPLDLNKLRRSKMPWVWTKQRDRSRKNFIRKRKTWEIILKSNRKKDGSKFLVECARRDQMSQR